MKEHLRQNIELTERKIAFWRNKQAKQPGPGVLKRHNIIADLIKKYNSDIDAQILDIGGREGFLCDVLKRRGYKNFFIIDLSQEAIKFAKERGYNGQVMDAEKINLNRTFDIIIASHVLEHCKEPNKIINQCYNLLNRKGIFFIEVPQQKKEKVPTKYGHWYLFSDNRELIEFFDNRWELLFEQNYPIRVIYKKK